MSGGLGVLSMAWISVEASMPLGWRLMAPVRDADGDDWLATAAGPLDGRPSTAAAANLIRLSAGWPTSCDRCEGG